MVYELSQGEHRCTWDPDYPEHPGRLLSVLARYDNANGNDDNDANDDIDDNDDNDANNDDIDCLSAGAMTLASWAGARGWRPGEPQRKRFDPS